MLTMGSGKKPEAPPLTEPIAVADAFANGVEAWVDGQFTWLAFFVYRKPAADAAAQRVITSRVCIPSADFPQIKEALQALSPDFIIDIRSMN